jgi:hypothetical protein
MVNFKTTTPSYKSKRYVFNPPEKWFVVEDYYPKIVERETWELAQKLRHTRRRPVFGESNPLTGLLYCYDCKAKMTNRRHIKDYGDENGIGRTYRDDNYECSTNRVHAARFIDKCSLHFVTSGAVREMILETIKCVALYARENETEFAEKLREASTIKQANAAKESKRQLAKNERRIAELDILFRKVYEDNATGKLTDERYSQMSAAYDSEQSGLKAQNETLRAELEAFEQDSLKADGFITLVRRYTEFDELTNSMLHEFVDKICIHEADKSSGERRQQVDIYLNYIGKFAIPGNEPEPLTPEEIAAEEERLEKKRKKNENLREWRRKRKERVAAEKVKSPVTLETETANPQPKPAA